MRSRWCTVAATFMLAASGAGHAHAAQRWELDPGGSGEWVLVEAAEDLPASEDPARGAPAYAPREEERPPRRSGGAIAGGVVLTAVSALVAATGGLVLMYSVAIDAPDDEVAAAGAVTTLGLGGTAGGIALIVWGAGRDRPGAAVHVAPGGVQIGGRF